MLCIKSFCAACLAVVTPQLFYSIIFNLSVIFIFIIYYYNDLLRLRPCKRVQSQFLIAHVNGYCYIAEGIYIYVVLFSCATRGLVARGLFSW